MNEKEIYGRIKTEVTFPDLYRDNTNALEYIRREQLHRLAEKVQDALIDAPAIIASLGRERISEDPSTRSITMRREVRIDKLGRCIDCEYACRSVSVPPFMRYCSEWDAEVPPMGFCHRWSARTKEGSPWKIQPL